MHPGFIDRHDAALKLIPLLKAYQNEPGVVLAVPRGGVPIAYYIAKKFNLPLDLLMTKKIGHPLNSEYAIGAVSLQDQVVDDHANIPKEYVDREIARIRRSLVENYRKYMGDHKPIDLKNKTVIIVDDGIATGNTILSSIKMLKQHNPKKIVVAVPVAPAKVAAKLKNEVDDFICLYTPEYFIGVGMHYGDFSEVSDEEVIRMLKDVNHIEDAA